MNGRSAGGFALLLIGSLGLIGYLSGNFDRWLAFLFSPAGAPIAPTGAPAPTVAPAPASSSAGAAPTTYQRIA